MTEFGINEIQRRSLIFGCTSRSSCRRFYITHQPEK
jgi:hypothetical protein